MENQQGLRVDPLTNNAYSTYRKHAWSVWPVQPKPTETYFMILTCINKHTFQTEKVNQWH